jgi:hypothetical protein
VSCENSSEKLPKRKLERHPYYKRDINLILATTAKATFVKGVSNVCKQELPYASNPDLNVTSKGKSKLRLWNLREMRKDDAEYTDLGRNVQIEVCDAEEDEVPLRNKNTFLERSRAEFLKTISESNSQKQPLPLQQRDLCLQNNDTM